MKIQRSFSTRRVWAVVLLLGAAVSAFGELPFKQFTPDGGLVRLPSASVQKVLQDRAGYIWLGFFSSGLSRYDGHSMRTFGAEDGLVNRTVREIVQDRTGRLWVGTSSNLVVSELPVDAPDGRPIRFVSQVGSVMLPEGLQIRSGSIVLDHDGWVSVAMPGEIRQYKFSENGVLSQRSIKLAATTAYLGVGHDGTIYASFEDGGFATIARGETSAVVRYDEEYGPQTSTALGVSRAGDLLIGMRSGEVWLRRAGSKSFERLPVKATERIATFAEAEDGTILAGTLGGGTLTFRLQGPPMVRTLTRVDGLLGETVWSILSDREGSLWFGQNGGLSRLRHDYRAFENLTALSHMGEKPLLADASSFGVAPPLVTPASSDDPSSWLWIITGGGVTVVGAGQQTRELRLADGLLSNSVYGIHRDEHGTVWMATAGGLNAVTFGEARAWPGVTETVPIRIFGRDAKLLKFALQQISYTPRTVHTSQGESLFCVGSRVGLSCLVDDTWILLGVDAGLTYVYDFNLDTDNFLWVARYDRGVFRSREPFSLDTLRRIGTSADSRVTESGMEARSLMFDHVDGGGDAARSITMWNGAVWGGLAEGLARFRNGKRDLLLTKNELGGDLVNAVLQDRRGGLWVAHSNGLTEVDQNLNVVRRLTSGSGLISNESWSPMSLAAGVDGRLYFATPSGVSIVQSDSLGTKEPAPAVAIEDFALNEKSGGRNEVVISYAALTFVDEQAVRYRTRLVGYDDDFSSPQTSTSLRYTNLPALPGSRQYVFEVSATNGDGTWSEPVRRAFTVQPGK